jgi:hypothetical protein
MRHSPNVIRGSLLLGLAMACALPAAVAQRVPVHGVPAHAEGLTETLVSVPLRADVNQVGVLSLKTGATAPDILAVLLPGSPSVVRPVVQGGVMTNSQLTGNFLIRSRRHLVDERIATLVVDCPTDSGDTCASAYQASAQRQIDVQLLIAKVQQMQPSLKQVWLVGTSLGTVSSSFMALYGGKAYAGAIHTASITEPLAKNSVRELQGFDYGKADIPQYFVHHRDDPCSVTTYTGAVRIAEAYKLPLITVTGGSGFTGGVCQAQTQHGFKGREQDVMHFMAETMKTGMVASTEL